MAETKKEALSPEVTGPQNKLMIRLSGEYLDKSSNYLIDGGSRALRDIFPGTITYKREPSLINGIETLTFYGEILPLNNEKITKLKLIADGICSAFKGQVATWQVQIQEGYKGIFAAKVHLVSATIDFGDGCYQMITIEDAIAPDPEEA